MKKKNKEAQTVRVNATQGHTVGLSIRQHTSTHKQADEAQGVGGGGAWRAGGRNARSKVSFQEVGGGTGWVCD